MQKPPPSGKRRPAPSRFTLGRTGIAKLNALEGIEQSEESKRMFEELRGAVQTGVNAVKAGRISRASPGDIIRKAKDRKQTG